MTRTQSIVAPLVAAGLILSGAAVARAEEMPVHAVEMDGKVIRPAQLVVAAGKPFALALTNIASQAVEFECASLYKEKVLPANAKAKLVFRKLSAGEYECFDDFNPDGGKLRLIAK